MKKLLYILIAGSSLFIYSCATNPVQRIDKYPDKYSNLPPDEQSLVEDGRITEGMSKDAVYLALGKPDDVGFASKGGEEFEIWSYITQSPIVRNRIGFHGGFGGFGHGRFGRSGRFGRFGGFGFGPSVTYVPRRTAIVKFSEGLVAEYQVSGRALN